MRRYQVLRPIDDPNYAIVELEFDATSDAESFLAAMREVWGRVEGTIIQAPRARIVEAVERKEFRS